MKQALFNAVSTAYTAVIAANILIGNMVIETLGVLFGFGSFVLSRLSKATLTAIDKDRYEYISSTLEQSHELTELNLMKAVLSVKESALGGGYWTASHTMALSSIGRALLNDCGWEPARVHGYMRQVVESIPGMSYMGGGDPEEE